MDVDKRAACSSGWKLRCRAAERGSLRRSLRGAGRHGARSRGRSVMLREIKVRHRYGLDDYRAHVDLTAAVARLERAAEVGVDRLRGRRIWMVSSTAQGGGVAEMLPGLIGVLRDLDLDARWLVVDPHCEEFFHTTKRLHNLLHDAGSPDDGHLLDERLYRDVSEQLAAQLIARVEPEDILVIHDPQPAGCGSLTARHHGCQAVWRSHVGFDRETPHTERAWQFLAPWLTGYDRCVFTLRDYVPEALAGRSAVIPPAIDPLSHKNRPMSIPKLIGVLGTAGLIASRSADSESYFEEKARRAGVDGTFVAARSLDEIGLLDRPMVTQISRWDRLKGWDALLEGFARLKVAPGGSPRHRRAVGESRLLLAGPDPLSVSDDPQAADVLAELVEQWRVLPQSVRDDVAILLLPMASRKANALTVNALQRCATVVVQNSRREGFGLTVTEAMWKSRPVLGSSAVGIAAQIADGRDGRLVENADDPDEIASTLGEMLAQPKVCETYGLNAARRVAKEYLLFAQAERWVALMSEL